MSGTAIDYVNLGPQIAFDSTLFAGALERIWPGVVAAARTAPTLVGNTLKVTRIYPEEFAFDILAVDENGCEGSIAGVDREFQIERGLDWIWAIRDSLPDYWRVYFHNDAERPDRINIRPDPVRYRTGDYHPHPTNLYLTE